MAIDQWDVTPFCEASHGMMMPAKTITNTPRAGEDPASRERRGLPPQVKPPLGGTVLGTQVGGDHYTKHAIQPVEYIWANGLGFSEGNVIKYMTRWRDKGGIKDLRKAAHHINLLIEWAEKQEAKGVKYGLQST
jgi:hypothetical protein